MTKKIEELNVSISAGKPMARFYLKGEENARYHIWLTEDGDTRSVIYKNPRRAMRSGDEGYFAPRRLDSSKPVNAALIADVCRMVREGDLIAAARREVEEKEAAERAADREADRERVRAALRELANLMDETGRHVCAGAVRGASLELDGEQLDAISDLFA